MNLLFDLDGTLTDPREGITKSLNFALAKAGHGERDPDTLLRYIGPPLNETFRDLLDTDDPDLISLAVAYYRERYFDVGWQENAIYPGVFALLHGLRERGHRLYVATSKRDDIARRILAHFELDSMFVAIYGADVDRSKDDLVAALVADRRLDPAMSVMIGDRMHDVRAGLANGVQSIGVLWGFGSADELTNAGAAYLTASMSELETVIARISGGKLA
jgi:phosphoglycolate phosphatase